MPTSCASFADVEDLFLLVGDRPLGGACHSRSSALTAGTRVNGADAVTTPIRDIVTSRHLLIHEYAYVTHLVLATMMSMCSVLSTGLPI